MNKQEIGRLIEKYEIVRECAEERLNEFNLQLKQIEKPEPEKPKPLEHGDVRLSFYSKSPFLVYDDDIFWLTELGRKKQADRLITEDVFAKSTLLCNLVGDLKAIKPIKEFEIQGNIVEFDNDGDIRIPISYLKPENIHEFILGFRGIEMKLIMDAKK